MAFKYAEVAAGLVRDRKFRKLRRIGTSGLQTGKDVVDMEMFEESLGPEGVPDRNRYTVAAPYLGCSETGLFVHKP